MYSGVDTRRDYKRKTLTLKMQFYQILATAGSGKCAQPFVCQFLSQTCARAQETE